MKAGGQRTEQSPNGHLVTDGWRERGKDAADRRRTQAVPPVCRPGQTGDGGAPGHAGQQETGLEGNQVNQLMRSSEPGAQKKAVD